MNDLELLKDLPGSIEPLDLETKERMQAVMEARTAVPPIRGPRRGVKVGILGIAAVLAAASLAAAFAVHPWTAGDPVALQSIPDPSGPVSSTTDVESVVAEFAPAIHLPEGGSFDVWVKRQESLPISGSTLGNGLDRVNVVHSMVFVAQCQWGQRWLDASSKGDRAGTAQALQVLGGIDDWFRSNAPDDDFGTTGLLDPMKSGDRVGVQSAENGCGYTGSWGTTPTQQDTTAKGRLDLAVQTVKGYLGNGGNSAAFDPSVGGNLAPEITWTSSHEQPAPASPGFVFIGPSVAAGVTLVSVSESGTQFCAVVTDSSAVHGTTTDDLSVTDAGTGEPHAVNSGSVTCTPGGW
jgi:hypothetical protein